MTTDEKIYLRPGTVAEAMALAKQNGKEFRFLAGGTDVLLHLKERNENFACLIDISALGEWRKILFSGRAVSIGSLCTLYDIEMHSELTAHVPLLADAARSVAAPVIRRTATIGGNVLCANRCVFYDQSLFWREAAGNCLKDGGDTCLATGGSKACFSRFVSDVAIALVALNAEVEIITGDGEKRRLPLENIYSGDGIKPLVLPAGFLLTAFYIPLRKQAYEFFKLRPRKSIDFTSLTLCAVKYSEGIVRIVIGGMDPKPLSVQVPLTCPVKDVLRLANKARTVDNDFFSRPYRRKVMNDMLSSLWRKWGGKG